MIYARRVSVGPRNSRALLRPSNDRAQAGCSDERSPTNGPAMTWVMKEVDGLLKRKWLGARIAE